MEHKTSPFSPSRNFMLRWLPAILLLFPLSCQSLPPAAPLAPDTARFEGVMLWKGHPVSRAALFLAPKDHPGGDIEFLTRADGHFSYDLPTGRYGLRSAPTTMCPVQGEVHLVAGGNRYEIHVHPLSFLSCRKGTIRRLSDH